MEEGETSLGAAIDEDDGVKLAGVTESSDAAEEDGVMVFDE